MKGPITYTLLLLASFVVCYQLWTNDTEQSGVSTGDVVLWTQPSDSLQKVIFENEKKVVTVIKKSEGPLSYWWGTEQQTKKKKKSLDQKSTPGSKDTPPADTPLPQPEDVIVTEFPVGKPAETLATDFSTMRAILSIGPVTEDKQKEYGFDVSKAQLTVVFDGSQQIVTLGNNVHGSSDKYGLIDSTQKAYVFAGKLLQPLERGALSLSLKDLHDFKKDDLEKIALITPSETKTLVRVASKDTTKKQKNRKWALEESPDTPDTTLTNVISKLEQLRPTTFPSDLQSDRLTQILTVKYYDKQGKDLESLGIYKLTTVPAPAEPDKDDTSNTAAKQQATPQAPNKTKYYVKNHRTRGFAEVSSLTGDQVEQNILQVFENK